MQAILVSPSTSRDFNTATQQSLTCTSLLRGQPRAEHSPSTLESLANRLKKLKNGVRRGMRKDLSCQQSEHTTGLSKPSSNEARSGFRKNLFGFARSVCSLTNHLNSSPKFSSEDCYAYLQDSYELPSSEVQVLPDWIQCQSVPPISFPFNLAPITPSEIKCTPKLCSNSSTPGEDRITYHILKNLPTTHHFLATLSS